MPKPRPILTREKILEAGLKLLDKGGLESLSMRKLASSLGVEAMSLYNHVKDKEDLLHGIGNLVLSRIEQPSEVLSWRETLEAFAYRIYETMIEHPPLASVLASAQRDPDDPKVLQGINRVLLALEKAGLSPKEQVNAYRGLLALCLGFVFVHTQGLSKTKAQAEQAWANWDDFQPDKLVFPDLARVLPSFKQTRPDDDFKFMLQAYLESLERKNKKA